MVNDARLPYRQRLVDPFVEELFTQLSALMVIGPRAAGKGERQEGKEAGGVVGGTVRSGGHGDMSRRAGQRLTSP